MGVPPVIALLVGVALMSAVPAMAGKAITVRVSVSATGHNANSSSSTPSVSANGRFVAFSSYASNVVQGDTNGASDIFVRDLLNNTTARVSVSSSGAQANGDSFTPSISADGNAVAFESTATNLVAGDTEGHADIFVHYMSTGATIRVSVAPNGTGGNDDSTQPAISADASTVAFASAASNLVSQPVNATGFCCDIYVRNLASRRTMLADPMTDGTGSGDSFTPVLSATGRYVAFFSWGCSLVNVPCLDEANVYRLDTQTGKMLLVTRSTTGRESNGCAMYPAISADGSQVAFASTGADLIAGDTNGDYDVFVRNVNTQTTRRVSVTSKGAQTNGGYGPVAMSSTGEYIVFQSDAWNIVPDDTNGVTDIFVHDMKTGKTTRASVSSSGAQANGFSQNAAVSGDGTVIAFESDATNLVPSDTNNTTDIFARIAG